jgi:NADH-quinone oxidoreductase subunit K
MIPLEHILGFSAGLFGLGLLGLCLQRSILRVLLAIEAMLNGAAFGFVGTAAHFGQVEGHVMFLMVLAVAAAEVSIGLSVLLHYDRLFNTLDIRSIPVSKE